MAYCAHWFEGVGLPGKQARHCSSNENKAFLISRINEANEGENEMLLGPWGH